VEYFAVEDNHEGAGSGKFVAEFSFIVGVENLDVGPHAGGDGADAALYAEDAGGIVGGGGDGFGRGEAHFSTGEGDGEGYGGAGGRAGVVIGGEGEGTAGVYKLAGGGVAIVEVEAAAGEGYADGWTGSEFLYDGGRGGLEVIDADGVVVNGPFGHAEGVELVGVDADGAAVVLGGGKEALGVFEGPGAFFAIGIAGYAGELIGDGREGFGDGLFDVVGVIGIEGVGSEEGANEKLGCLLGGSVDGAEHFEFGFGIEAVAGFYFYGAGAEGGHIEEAAEEVYDEFILVCFSDGADGGHDAAAGFEYVEVGMALEGHFELIEAASGPAGVGVAVDEAGHEDAAVHIENILGIVLIIVVNDIIA